MNPLILQRLNMDTTWHCTLGSIKLLIDPWLVGTEVDYFGWFNTQWHRTPPTDCSDLPPFDAVLITQKYPDHCHPETLRALNPRTIVAPEHMIKRIQKLVPEATIVGIKPGTGSLLHDDVHIHLLATPRRRDPIYDAVLLDDGHRSILIAPHGLSTTPEHAAIVQAASPIKVLLAPFDHYQLPGFLGGVIKPGLPGLQSLVDQFQPEVVIQTHDEDKHARGLVSQLAQINSFCEDDLTSHAWLAQRHQSIPNYQPVTF